MPRAQFFDWALHGFSDRGNDNTVRIMSLDGSTTCRCENVHEVDPSVIGQKAVNFKLFLGPKQPKMKVELVEKLVEHSASVLLIRLESSGKNAVDFALAYYLGRRVLSDPTAYFHIVSKDKGFDPLIEHLRNLHIHARRHDDFATLTFSGPKKAATTSVPTNDTLESRVLGHLQKNAKNRPKRRDTLESYLSAFLGNAVAKGDISALIEKLCKDGRIKIGDKDSVTYHL